MRFNRRTRVGSRGGEQSIASTSCSLTARKIFPVVASVLLMLPAGGGAAQEQDGAAQDGFRQSGKPPETMVNEGVRAGDDNGQRRVAMNFQDVDIPVLARFVSELTNKNFIVDEK